MLKKIFPFLGWFEKYNGTDFRIDFVSGLTVALVLIPQSMAYAQLAGLPPYYGLYASFLPPMIAALFGSSRQLATGPVAVVSLMTLAALEPLASAGTPAFIAYAIVLALLIGFFQFMLGVLRLGLVVNFLSHPVVNGFTNAAAIIIATSQLSKLFGVATATADHHYETVYHVIRDALVFTHMPTLYLGALAFFIMILIKRLAPRLPGVLLAVVITTVISWSIGYEHNRQAVLENIRSPRIADNISRYGTTLGDIERKISERIEIGHALEKEEDLNGLESAEIIRLNNQLHLLAFEIGRLKEDAAHLQAGLSGELMEGVDSAGVLLFYEKAKIPEDLTGDGLNWRLKVGGQALDEANLKMIGGGSVVGTIPKGLPTPRLPAFDLKVMLTLFPTAIIISFLGFMEAISIAKAMAVRTGQRLNPNQELIGQGLSNLAGSLFQGYAVSGSFSRSAVNLQAGARTGMSSLFSSLIVAVALLFLTPLLYYLPQSVLAAIIMMAVIGLINIKGFIHAWRAQTYDGLIGIITFVATLIFAPHLDRGIMIGVILSLGLYLVRNIKPEIVNLSLYTDGTYRNAERLGLMQCRHIAVIRISGSLIFASVSYLEERVLEKIRSMPELRAVILVGNGINELDASGEEKLSELVDRLRDTGCDIFISGLNDQVLDVMKRTHLYAKIGEDHLYRNVAWAIEACHEKSHQGSGETICPLTRVCFKGLPTAAAARKDPMSHSSQGEEGL